MAVRPAGRVRIATDAAHLVAADTNGCRALIDAVEHEVVSVTPPGRTGWIELIVKTGMPQQ